MSTTNEELKYAVDYWEKLLSDMDDLKERLKEHRSALKAKGHNVKMLAQLVNIRRKDKGDEASQDINDLLMYAAATGTNLNVVADLEPTPIEAAIQASKAADDGGYDAETGEVLDRQPAHSPVLALAKGLTSGDPAITKAAARLGALGGASIDITPSPLRGWPADVPTHFDLTGGAGGGAA